MIRPIVTNEFFLSLPSEPAPLADAPIARDLVDTLRDHEDGCVGMAANMIGQRKRIIVFRDGAETIVMLNPEIVSSDSPYMTREGCLSLEGTRPVRRFSHIEVAYQDESGTARTEGYAGFTAQIIQHEIDHCNGIVV